MRKLLKDKKGATLVELILYIAISAFVLASIAAIMSQIVYGQVKVETISREDENARVLMRLMTQDIEFASSIDTPSSINATSSSLILTDSSNNTITYSISSGVVYKQYGTGTNTPISSTDIYVSNLTFEVESEAGVAPSINIKIDIQQNSTSSTLSTHYETTVAQRIF